MRENEDWFIVHIVLHWIRLRYIIKKIYKVE
jgi:hypothetical protein